MDLKKLLLNDGQRTNIKKGLVKNLMEQVSSDSQFKLSETIALESAQAKGQDGLKLFKGALFKVGKNRILVSNTKYQMVKSDNGMPTTSVIEGTVHYNCKAGKFYIPGKPNTYYNEDYPNVKPDFKKFCAVAKQTKSIGGGGGKVTDVKLNEYPCVIKLIDNPLGGKTTINKEDNGQSITWQQKLDDASGMITFFNNGRYERGGKVFTYYCDGNKIKWSKQQTSKPTPDIGSGGAPTTQSQTPTLIKQIQKTIGVAETGKLTDTEIQTIYDKLNPSAPVNVNEPEARAQTTSAIQAIQQLQNQTAPTQLAGVKTESISEEINRIKEMMGIVLNEQSTPTESQPEKTPTEKLQELLNTKFSAGLVVDGKMGPKTAQAIINALGKATTTSSQTVSTPSSTNQTSTESKPEEKKPEPEEKKVY